MAKTQVVARPAVPNQASEPLVKHLEMIQGVINRMANNSFLLKGWSVTLVAALVGFSANESVPWFAMAAMLPGISFWMLDAYYLRQERLYRALYDAVRTPTPTESGLGAFTLSTRGFEPSVPSLLRTAFTPTIFAIHGTTLTVAVAAAVILGVI